MIDKKIITPDGLDLLWRIMKTCPATPLNGGQHAKEHLQKLCANGQDVLGCELRLAISNELLCECEGETDIYTHLLENTYKNSIGIIEVMEYFGGNIHGEKILADTKKGGLPEKYALKVIYGHALVPIVIDDPSTLISIDDNGTIIENLLTFSDDNTKYNQGDIALMHYGFIIGKATAAQMDVLNNINKKSPLFLKALEQLKDKMDFATMHYFPRSRKMAGK